MAVHDEPRAPLESATAVVLCENALLGEGLAARLRDIGVAAVVVTSPNNETVAAALQVHPDVVIAELCDERRVQVSALAPQPRVVDIASVVGRGCPESADLVRFDAIWAALCDESAHKAPAAPTKAAR